MKRWQPLLLGLSIFLILPIVATALSEGLDQDGIQIAVFVFYPVSALGIYASILYAHILRVKVEKDRVTICKWLLIPVKILVRRSAIRSIRVKKKVTVPTSGQLKGIAFDSQIVTVYLMNGRTIRSNDLPYISLADSLAIERLNATWQLPIPGAKKIRNVTYRLHISAFILQLALIAGGILLNRQLYSMLT